MKRSLTVIAALLLAISLFTTSCTKPPIIPGETINNGGSNGSSCTITFNGNDTRTADSTHWDYYSGLTRVQAFKNGSAIMTLWLNGNFTSSYTLAYQNLYWVIQYPTIYTVNSYGGTVYLVNNGNVLSGTLNATGDPYSGSGGQTTISASFSNVRQLGH